MRDYENTAKALRCCRLTSARGCAECPYSLNSNEKCANLLPNAADAIAELLAAVPRWISVKESLPEKGKPVLVYGKRGGIYTALFEGGKYWWKLNSKSHYCEPTHWMPLPEPPPKGAE